MNRDRHSKTGKSSTQRGFSIIEALIAGLVLSFGMLALVGTQVALSRNGEVARQRTEATRLAQERMEIMRAYASGPAVTGVSSFQSLASNNVEPAIALANTNFTRTWTVDTSDPYQRTLSVLVRWNDRAGQAQEVRLSSVISRTDYWRVGLAMANAGGSGLTGVRRRDNAVPFASIPIGNDRSTYQWPGTNRWYVFSNTDADILFRCTTQPTSSTNLNTDCAEVRGYVVAGYISVEQPNGNGNNNPVDFDASLPGWTINQCSIVGGVNISTTPFPPSCFVQSLIVGGVINPSCPYITSNVTPTSQQLTQLRYFKCYAALIELADPNGDGWGGKMTFTTAPTGQRRICRYENNHVIETGNNAGYYENVEESLSNENYFARMSGNCGTGQDQHQP